MASLGIFFGILFLLVGLIQIYAGYVGIEYHLGAMWAWGAIGAAFLLRLMLPLTIGAYFAAHDVWGWPWYAAAIFAAPGLLFVLPAAISKALATLKDAFSGASTSQIPTSKPSQNTTYDYTTIQSVSPATKTAALRVEVPKVTHSSIAAKPGCNVDPYQQAGEEVLSGNVAAGLWARALVEGGGNDGAVKAAYVKLRVAQLHAEARAATEERERLATQTEARKAKIEDYLQKEERKREARRFEERRLEESEMAIEKAKAEEERVKTEQEIATYADQNGVSAEEAKAELPFAKYAEKYDVSLAEAKIMMPLGIRKFRGKFQVDGGSTMYDYDRLEHAAAYATLKLAK